METEIKYSNNELDIAYRYPFSKEAKEIISTYGNALERRLLNYGMIRVQNALDKKNEDLTSDIPNEIKIVHILSYAYARMIASGTGSKTVIKAFVSNEAFRSVSSLIEDKPYNISLITQELNLDIKKDKELLMIPLEPYLNNMSNQKEFNLIFQDLKNGYVYLSKEKLSRFLIKRIEIEINKNLPIPKSELPEEVFEFSKKIKMPPISQKVKFSNNEKYNWIKKLMERPIADVRHRTVNLILAPYFTNIVGLSEEDAFKVINNYIEKCKEINPDTDVNESYIRYQIKYAKLKGMKPLSYLRAKELLGEDILK
ncbi:MAG: DNA primase noncatalytic subunit PriX [Candidatus Micrarchaeia archaeon]